MSSPLTSVLSAVTDGATSRADVAVRTGLARDVADAAVDHLVRMGRLDVHALGTTCPGGACGSCPSGNDGAPGCETGLPSGPVLLQISLHRVDATAEGETYRPETETTVAKSSAASPA